MGGFHVFIVAVVCIGLGFACWFIAPKGVNQTLLRSSLLLTITCLYLMWAVTYMAQLHPLMGPKRSDIRLEAD